MSELRFTLDAIDAGEPPDDFVPMHEGHMTGHLGQSRTLERVRLYCCDNCGRHHWGEYTGGYWAGADYVDVDFDYRHPDGSPYMCPAGLHALYGGPEYCMGSCWPCEYARQQERSA